MNFNQLSGGDERMRMKLLALCVPCMAMLSNGCCGGEGPLSASWDFSTGACGWKAAKEAAPLEASGCLKLQGAEAEALSQPFPLEAGKLYTASCSFRKSPSQSQVLLKCEFYGEGSARAGEAKTGESELAPDRAERIVLQFRAPKNAKSGALRVESPSLEIFKAEIKEQPRAEWAGAKYNIKPIPKPLLDTAGVHPRLFLTPDSAKALKAKAQGPLKELAGKIVEKSEALGKAGPPAYTTDDKEFPDQQLWQRGVGDALPVFAMAWLITGDKRHLDWAGEWASASCSYPTWGLGHNDMVELAAGHQLFGLAVLYDWCHDALPPKLRETIKTTLLVRGGKMFECAAAQNPWWMGTRLQNHQWINLCGLSAAAFATWDENKEALPWLAITLDRYKLTMASLGPDGASIEGPGYWSYGVDYLLRFMFPARSLLGEDLFQSPWWRETASYRLYQSLPLDSWNAKSSVVDLADSNRKNWGSLSCVLRTLAAEFRDGRAQWLAAKIKERDMERQASWLLMLWGDPSLPEKGPADEPALPTLKHFEDIGIVSARSSWKGDESLVVFKCAPPAGHQQMARFHNSDVGHVHPDAAHFDIFGCGDWLIRDDGYRMKFSAQHNTLLIDGAGQSGEGSLWLKGQDIPRKGPAPRILECASTPAFDRIVAEAAPAYPASAGLLNFTRTLVFVKPSALIVHDSVKLSSPKALELKFHPEFQPKADADGAFLCKGEKSVLRIEFAGKGQAAITETPLPPHGAYPPGSMHCVKRTLNAQEWSSLAVFTWSPAGEEPAKASVQELPDGSFKVGLQGIDFEFTPKQGARR